MHAFGRSRGGFSTKIPGLCDALGRPRDCLLSAGQAADCTYARPLVQQRTSAALLADKGYDTDALVTYGEQQGAACVMPPKKNRPIQRRDDKERYKARHTIACMCGFLTHYRRVCARFEQIASRFHAFLHFAAALQWIK